MNIAIDIYKVKIDYTHIYKIVNNSDRQIVIEIDGTAVTGAQVCDSNITVITSPARFDTDFFRADTFQICWDWQDSVHFVLDFELLLNREHPVDYLLCHVGLVISNKDDSGSLF